MDLHTGIPLWAADRAQATSYPVFQGNAVCDVAVIGGGITGALVSHLLTKSGVATILLDKHIPGEGSTIGSTGLLQYEVDTPLSELMGKVGEARAVHAYRRGLKAIDELESLLTEVKDRCDFEHRPSLYLASEEQHVKDLQREYDCRREFGFEVDWLNAGKLAEISSLRAAGAIWSLGDAQINPYRLTQKLLRSAVAAGLNAYQETLVTDIEEADDLVTLTTPTGSVHCKSAIFATGYQANKQLPGSPGNLKSTYALASAPLPCFPGWPLGCLLWESARPYFYARQTSDGRAIIGGEDTEHSEDHTNPDLLARKAAKLTERFGQMFPEIPFTPNYVWGGTFAETKDGLAYIGRVRPSSRIYAALGYGGNGITFSAIAAKLLTDLVLGRENPDAAVFTFDR